MAHELPISKIDRNLGDLHLNDRLNRLRLRDWMREEQKRQGVHDKALSERVGHNSSWSLGILRSDTWRAATLQKIVRALGYRLTFNVDIDIVPVPATSPSMMSVYANHANPERREEADRIDLCTLGARLREARGMDATEVGRIVNQTGSQVRSFESGDKPYYMLVTAQRYFRAIGGELKLVLAAQLGSDGGYDVPFEAPEGRWPDTADTTVRVAEGDGRVLMWNAHTPGNVVSFPETAFRMWLEQQRG